MANNAFTEGLESAGRIATEREPVEAAPTGATAQPSDTKAPDHSGAAIAEGAGQSAADEQAAPEPTLLAHQTLDNAVAAQLLWVSGHDKPFVVPMQLLEDRQEHYQPLLEINDGDVVPLELLQEAHKESAKYFETAPVLPEKAARDAIVRGAQAAADIQAEKEAAKKAREEAKGLKSKMQEHGEKAAYGADVQGNGFLASLLKAYKEGKVQGYRAAEAVKDGVVVVAKSTAALAAGTVRGVGHVAGATQAGAEGVKSMAAATKRVLKGPTKVDVDKIAAKGSLEYLEFVSSGPADAKSKVNVEFLMGSSTGKGAFLRFTDAEGNDIGKSFAKASGFKYEKGGAYKDGGVLVEGKTPLRSTTNSDVLDKLVTPHLAKMGLPFPTAVTYGARFAPDVARIYRESIVAAELAKQVKAAPPARPDKPAAKDVKPATKDMKLTKKERGMER